MKRDKRRVRPEVRKIILDYLEAPGAARTDAFNTLDPEDAVETYALARQYGLHHLEWLCCAGIEDGGSSVERTAHIVRLADDRGLKDLKEMCMQRALAQYVEWIICKQIINIMGLDHFGELVKRYTVERDPRPLVASPQPPMDLFGWTPESHGSAPKSTRARVMTIVMLREAGCALSLIPREVLWDILGRSFHALPKGLHRLLKPT